ncbi:hypothetical protein WJX72_007283 [[Myrmecia] bisecta]|uniref:M23ase beta-sheet core domain-containing protein n=1 Tax=[Myrmecia] bisecta TaxID=41462 RepID=A0AAW1R8F3_9CHLO
MAERTYSELDLVLEPFRDLVGHIGGQLQRLQPGKHSQPDSGCKDDLEAEPMPPAAASSQWLPPDSGERRGSDTGSITDSEPDALSLIAPVDDFLLSSKFGMRGGRLHKGVDLAAHTGTPVVAALDGRVTFASFEDGYGNVLELEHRNGWRTLYAHNHANLRKVGDEVEQGELIALVDDPDWPPREGV